jgi:DNA repair protein RadC
MSEQRHAGHRSRLKERFLKEGSLDNFTDHQVIELILFYCLPRKDTNPIAHDLLEDFGSFSSVVDKSIAELSKVTGISENSGVFLKLVGELSRRYYNDKVKEIIRLDSADKMKEFIKPKFIGRTDEVVYVICMDNTCKILSCDLLFEGTINAANINTRKIIETALKHNSANVILAHNHPQGLAMPSNEDIVTTQDIKKALKVIHVELVDHFIVAKNECTSLLESGYM